MRQEDAPIELELSTPFAKFEHRSRGGATPSASLPLLADVPASPRRGASHPTSRRSRALRSNLANGVLSVETLALLSQDQPIVTRCGDSYPIRCWGSVCTPPTCCP